MRAACLRCRRKWRASRLSTAVSGGFLETLDVELVTPFPLLAIGDLASSDLDQAALHHGFKRIPLKKIARAI